MTRKKKVWLKVSYWATQATLEVAQSALLEAGAIGIEVDDGLGPEGQQKYPYDAILVIAYFESDAEEEAIAKTFNLFFTECNLAAGPLDFSVFYEEDWQANFVRSCTTFKVEPGIYIVPSFEIEQFKKNPLGDLFIEMDPENAFGTGQHQTTKLCLKNIYELFQANSDTKNLSVLDVGTGSGILAILAKKLGYSLVVASETDEDALKTAEKNAIKNGVSIETRLVSETDSYEQEKYDLIVANILAPVLIAMASSLSRSLSYNGVLILSGILVQQAQDVIIAYQKQGLTYVQHDVMDDWCSLIFKRPLLAKNISKL